MHLLLFFFLAAADLSGLLGDYLRAAPGSETEAAAVERIRIWYDVDPGVVEEAIRNHLIFPAVEPGLDLVTFPLSGLVRDEQAPAENEAAIWVPRDYDPGKKWPVMVVVHQSGGRGQAEVEALGHFADQQGLLLLGPQDELRRGGGGWGFTDYEHAIHTQSLTWLKRRFNVDDNRVYLFGASRGGHASWDLAMQYPDLFAGAIPVIGGIPNRHFRFLANLLHVPVLDMQGAHDQAVLIELLHDAVKILKGWEYDVTYKEDPEASHFYPIDWDEVGKWMAKRRREPYPKHTIRVADRNARAGARWLHLRGLPERRFANVKPPRVDLADGPLTREEQKALVRSNYAKYCAKAEGRIAENVIDLTVKRAPQLTVYLHDKLIDFGEKVRIRVNGRIRTTRKVTRSLDVLLSRLKATGDRELLYHAAVEVRGER